MEKLRLLLAALLLCAGFSVQAQNVNQTSDAVLDIPTTGDYQLAPKAATIKMVTSAYVNFKEDGVTQFVEPQRYKGTGVYNEDNTVQYNQFDNMYNKDWVQFKLRNTAEKAYIIRFQTACKKDGSQVKFELKSGEDTDLEYTYNVPNTGNWGRWQDGIIFISDPIEMGNKTLTITFLNEDGTTTANLRNLRFEGVDGTIETSTLYTYKYVGDIQNDACGTIAIAPLQDTYINGSYIDWNNCDLTDAKIENDGANIGSTGASTVASFAIQNTMEQDYILTFATGSKNAAKMKVTLTEVGTYTLKFAVTEASSYAGNWGKLAFYTTDAIDKVPRALTLSNASFSGSIRLEGNIGNSQRGCSPSYLQQRVYCRSYRDCEGH